MSQNYKERNVFTLGFEKPTHSGKVDVEIFVLVLINSLFKPQERSVWS